MKKLLIPLFLLTFASTTVFADELPEAPQEDLQAAIKACKEWAVEDNVSEDKLAEYLLNCVNDDLTNLGYKNVAKID